MISAHIYSNEALPHPQERAVRDGLEMVADHIGERLVARHYRLVLPVNEAGLVDPETCNTFPRADFDKNIDLHIILARLAFADEKQMGLAYHGGGVAFVAVNMSRKDLRSTTTHEVAHSLSFVRWQAPHRKDHASHCRSRDCLMQPVQPIFNRKGGQCEDFCRHCQSDLADYGLEHLERLREYRSHRLKL